MSSVWISLWSCQTVSTQCLEVARTPTPCRLRSGSAVCGRVHPRAVQAARYHTVNDYSLSPTGRQTEHVNQELEQYLRVFVNERQDDWDELLPMAEFQYNNHIHSSTQQTPFLLDTGRHPRMGFEL